jgi:RNA polymerase sigma factor (sigma-70 family)
MNRGQSEFRRVYEENVWRVYGFLAYRLQDQDLVEDLTQATFERALRGWSRFDPGRASESTWLLAIAHNLLIDHYRRGHPRPAAAVEEDALGSVPGPEERLAGSSELADALSRLSEREQEVLALRFGGDLSGAEIAALLDLSVANVHQIQSRGVRKLRTLLTSGQSEARAPR